MRILIAEDDPVSALLLERTLKRGGYDVLLAKNGTEALDAILSQKFDALVTDWMMPNLDGLELTRRVRATVEPRPLIMMITALTSPEARALALEAGADDYLAKPIEPREVLARLDNCYKRQSQPAPVVPKEVAAESGTPAPPFVGVGIVASTGGPAVLTDIVRALSLETNAAYFIVLHGPPWLVETFVESLKTQTPLPVALVRRNERALPGSIYVAPGDRHMTVEPEHFEIQLSDGPPENFVRPAADPLFRSLACAFGRYGMALVLTGMGRDGSLGAAEIAAAGGLVMAQDPASAVAPSMPETVISLGVAQHVVPLDALARTVCAGVDDLARSLSD